MQATTFETLRDLVMHHAARRGWLTQRHVAVMCGLDESALSRLLNGEQDIGARRTHTIFQAVGIPADQYDTAYTLLGRAQEQARSLRDVRAGRDRTRISAPPAAVAPGRTASTWTLGHTPSLPAATRLDDVPVSVVIALFAARAYSGGQIATFFAA